MQQKTRNLKTENLKTAKAAQHCQIKLLKNFFQESTKLHKNCMLS